MKPAENMSTAETNKEAAEQPSGGIDDDKYLSITIQPASNSLIDMTPPDGDNRIGTNEKGPASSLASAASLMGQVLKSTSGSNDGTVIPSRVVLSPMARQIAPLSHLPQVQGQRTMAAIDASSLMHRLSSVSSISSVAGLQHVPQAPPPAQPLQSSQASLLHQLQLASLAHQNEAGLRMSVPQAPLMGSSLQASLLNQLTAAHAAQPLQLTQASLLHQLQLASLAHQNVAGLRMSVPQAPLMGSSLQASMLNQLTAAQTAQTRPFFSAPQPTHALTNAHLLQHLSAPQEPPLLPIAPQNQSRLLQSLSNENMVKDQLIALLLSHQQTGTAVSSSNTAASRMATSAKQMELLSQSMAATNPSTLTPGNANHWMIPTVASDLVYPLQNTSNSGSVDPTIKENAPPTKDPSPTLAVQAKEKRWMMRYEELKLFQQKYGHSRVPHGYSENRKLSWWVMNQRAQYQSLKLQKKSWLTNERVALLDAIGFDWKPAVGKSSPR